MSKEVCQSVGRVFSKTTHHVMTKAGESKLTFGYDKDRPIFGSWQGATKSEIAGCLSARYCKRYTKEKFRELFL